MKRDAQAGWWLVWAAILALWSVAGTGLVPPMDASSTESGFGMLQWKTT